ncbi:hypothetical protein J2Z66_004012 [Paenibacillus eucommiae]|uniref:Uncharacterized protein n=1 Tax=Paenibacillus eucommiae TaxID=1355755 RepID=A0ABS4IXU5_9BACL|nr:hypothetical protein [Paenibacillus eucommiae]
MEAKGLPERAEPFNMEGVRIQLKFVLSEISHIETYRGFQAC